MKLRSVIFDLDGTLIDSAPSILASMQAAFDEVGIRPSRPLSHDLIGPPLSQTLASIVDKAQKQRLPELIEHFKNHYDEAGYRNTSAYTGVQDMLQQLHAKNLNLYIATNKRILPTRKIVNHLEWTKYFSGIYALDYITPALKNKTALLKHLQHEIPDETSNWLYVGDRLEDAAAAQQNGVLFTLATWGYGGSNCELALLSSVQTPSDLLKQITARCQPAL